jgi:hypothetical protein
LPPLSPGQPERAERIAASGSGLLLAAPLADDPDSGGAALATLLDDLVHGRVALPPPLQSQLPTRA